jgi:hypothetical protein
LVPHSYEIKLSRLQRLGSARMDKLPLCYLWYGRQFSVGYVARKMLTWVQN